MKITKMTIEEMRNKLLSLIDDKMKLKKELAIYKKALKMMSEELSSTYDCDQGMNEICKICMSDIKRMKTETCSDFQMRYFIQKAKGELK